MMSQPVSYQPKTLANVQAMLNDGTDTSTQAILDWVVPLMGEDAQGFVNWPAQVYVQGEGFGIGVNSGQYLYLDEDGFHAVDASVFEMHYKIADGV